MTKRDYSIPTFQTMPLASAGMLCASPTVTTPGETIDIGGGGDPSDGR